MNKLCQVNEDVLVSHMMVVESMLPAAAAVGLELVGLRVDDGVGERWRANKSSFKQL